MVSGQGENNLWYFSGNGGLDFNQSPPIFTTDSQIRENSLGVCTVSDQDGNLLFYMNNFEIWNRNHEKIQVNQEDRSFGLHSSQYDALAIPISGDLDKYYIFRTFDMNDPNGTRFYELRYSILDLNLDSGRGGITSVNNVLLNSNMANALVAGKGYCNTIWLVGRSLDADKFIAFKIDEEGVHSEPIISSVGTVFHPNSSSVAYDLKFSSDYQMLSSCNLGDKVDLLNFNRSSGAFTLKNVINTKSGHPPLPPIAHVATASTCFSPNGRFLYATEWSDRGKVVQYDLQATTNDSIAEAKTFLRDIIKNQPTPNSYLQIGPDSLIYLNGVNRLHIGVINSPDTLGDGAAYNDEQIKVINNGVSLENAWGIQNLVVVSDNVSELEQPFSRDTMICDFQTFVLDATAPESEYLWQDGSTNATFQVDDFGTYWVERNVDDCVLRRDSMIIVQSRDLSFNLGTDTTLCPSHDIILGIVEPMENTEYLWSNGSIAASITADAVGCYWLQVTSGHCTFSDTIAIALSDMCDDDVSNGTSYYIPTVFSPNGDGNHDLFKVFFKSEIQYFRIRIYDRWGNIHYHSTDVNAGWDALDTATASGVYICHIDYVTTIDNTPKTIVASTTLIR